MFLSTFQKEEQDAFLALAKQLVAADGVLDENEIQLMNQFLQEMGVMDDQVEIMTMGAALEALGKSSMTVKKQIFIELVGLSKCDDSLDTNEEEILKHMASELGIAEETAAKLRACVEELFGVYNKMEELISE